MCMMIFLCERNKNLEVGRRLLIKMLLISTKEKNEYSILYRRNHTKNGLCTDISVKINMNPFHGSSALSRGERTNEAGF